MASTRVCAAETLQWPLYKANSAAHELYSSKVRCMTHGNFQQIKTEHQASGKKLTCPPFLASTAH